MDQQTITRCQLSGGLSCAWGLRCLKVMCVLPAAHAGAAVAIAGKFAGSTPVVAIQIDQTTPLCLKKPATMPNECSVCSAAAVEAVAAEAPPKPSLYEVEVTGASLGLKSDLTAAEHGFALDAGHALGGGQSAPSPVQAFIGSIVACTQVSGLLQLGCPPAEAAWGRLHRLRGLQVPAGRLPAQRLHSRGTLMHCSPPPATCCRSPFSWWPRARASSFP